MKASIFYGKHDLRTEQIQEPVVGDYEVKVRNKAGGICGTDIHIFYGEKGSADVNTPVILGHEYAGEVVEVGQKVSTIKVGDRVTIDPNMYCGKCHYCKIGKKNHCENLTAIGVNFDGGFAEYSVVPERQAFVLGDDIDFEVGAMAEPLACCLRGIDLAGIKAGDSVCVIGGGTIGQLMVQLAKLAGASVTMLSEPIAMRREMALENGTDFAFDPTTENLKDAIQDKTGIAGVDVVIECAGNLKATTQAFEIAKRGASIILFSVPSPGQTFSLDLFEVFQKELKLQGSFINPDTHQRAVNLIKSNKLIIKPLITHRYGLDEVETAIRKQMESESIKVLVTP